MAPSICGGVISSRRGLLASLWSVLSIVATISYLTALAFTLSAQNAQEEDDYSNNYQQQQEGSADQQQQQQDPAVAVTSRAMVFAALWTAVLSVLIGVFGTVILGWQSPTGQYYTCCSSSVHRTTPLGLGSFIGALLMLANLTLVCSVLFGEFQVRDYMREGGEAERQNDEGGGGAVQQQSQAEERSSMAFSILCMFLTFLYAGFAALTFAFSNSILEEHFADERLESISHNHHRTGVGHYNGGYNDGYIGERFDVMRNKGFVAPAPQPDGSLA